VSAVPVRLSWLLLRRGWDSPATTALPMVAFGSVTTLVLVVLAGAWSFRRFDGSTAAVYQLLAAFAVVVLVMPLLTLGGSAARLSARRRDDRLATLRLLGGTSRTVRVMTLLESTFLALAGAVLGVLGYLVTGPLLQRISFRGEEISDAYWLPAGVVALAPLGIALLAAVSAAVGLRRVVLGPLGVRTRQPGPAFGPARLLITVAVVVVSFVGLKLSGGLGVAIGVGVVLCAFAAVMGVLNLLGPWLVSLLARRQHRRAATPERLLAARNMQDAPKAVWRQVSGVAMISFVAVVVGAGTALVGMADAADGPQRFLVGDIRTGLVITVVVSFVMVACSVAVNAAAEIYDRGDLYRSLHKLGMPTSTMHRARVVTAMTPLLAVSAVSAAAGAVLALPLVGIAFVVSPLSLAVVVACLAGGALVVRTALAATAPILSSVLGEE
jgi:sterol desaturase/sphingolipid hydroxylase (fatty acid hydroxylase superfamily)